MDLSRTKKQIQTGNATNAKKIPRFQQKNWPSHSLFKRLDPDVV